MYGQVTEPTVQRKFLKVSKTRTRTAEFCRMRLPCISQICSRTYTVKLGVVEEIKRIKMRQNVDNCLHAASSAQIT